MWERVATSGNVSLAAVSAQSEQFEEPREIGPPHVRQIAEAPFKLACFSSPPCGKGGSRRALECREKGVRAVHRTCPSPAMPRRAGQKTLRSLRTSPQQGRIALRSGSAAIGSQGRVSGARRGHLFGVFYRFSWSAASPPRPSGVGSVIPLVKLGPHGDSVACRAKQILP